MVTGLISPTNLSGPITIARVASDSAKSGWESFITFLAYVSISLGILNLLPIPILDGGHLAYYTIEAVRGKPVSERIQEMSARFGLAILGTLMLMAFYFDLLRL
jgi:regulator of sigma E protease